MKNTGRAILGVLACAFWAFGATEKSVVLYVGQQKTLNVRGAEQISIAGKGKVATGTLVGKGNRIVVTGKAPGTVSMTIHYRNRREEEWRIRVLSRVREQLMVEFDKIAPLFNDLKMITIGSETGLVGKIYSIAEAGYLQSFLDRYPGIVNLTEDVRGSVLLQMDVQIMEVNLTGASNLGVEWFSESNNKVAFPQGLDYGEVKTETGGLRFGEEYVPRRILPNPQYAVGPIARLSPFSLKLRFLVDKGQAKVLARPKLVCRSGERADFLVGGEFPVRLATQEKVQVEWKRYGTRLEVEPVLVRMGSNEVDVRIHVEISDVDWGNQVDGVPAVTQRSVSTTVKVEEGHAIAIAGLLTKRKHRSQSRIPVLGAIPWLGRLFGTTRDQELEFETVITLSPRILPAHGQESNMKIRNPKSAQSLEKMDKE